MAKEKAALICDPAFISKVVNCVNDAVGDSIKEDMHGLRTKNSAPSRIWDLLNTKLCGNMPSVSCIANVTKRGSWQMVPVYDTSTGVLFTFMRENRYDELHKKVRSRKTPHYVDCLVDTLNPDLVAPIGQVSLFPIPFSEKERMYEVVQKILYDLQVEEQAVKRHALILFSSSGFELLSIRAVMIDKRMDVVCEENWEKYIPTNISAIMESPDEYSSPANNPGRGLKLSVKANERKKRNIGIKQPEFEKTSGESD